MTADAYTDNRALGAGMRVAFRVDASLSIGSGHVMRCLTLADALRKEGADCYFLCREHAGHLNELIGAQGFPIEVLPSQKADLDTVSLEQDDRSTTDEGARRLQHADWLDASQESDASQTLEILQALEPDWLIVDHYALDARWETRVRDPMPGVRMMVIDDLADRPHQADMLLDQNLGRKIQDYALLVPQSCKLLVGPRYALLNPVYSEYRKSMLDRRDKIHRVFVFFGGTDPQNLTGRVLEGLAAPDLEHLEVDVVVGQNNLNRERLIAQACARPNTHVMEPRPHLADIMANADLAIGAGGTTTWERCCLGLPTVVVSIADNQRPACEALAKEGGIDYLGHQDSVGSKLIRQAVTELIEQPGNVQAMARMGWELVDGEGARRIVGVMAATY